MKITDVRVLAKRMITPHPTLVEIETDEGITGIGATAAPSYVIAPLIEKGLYRPRIQESSQENQGSMEVYPIWITFRL